MASDRSFESNMGSGRREDFSSRAAPESGMGASETPYQGQQGAPEEGMGRNEGVAPHSADEQGMGAQQGNEGMGYGGKAAPEQGMGADEGIGKEERLRDEENEYGMGSGRGDDAKPGMLDKIKEKFEHKKK